MQLAFLNVCFHLVYALKTELCLYLLLFCKLKVRFLENAQISFLDFSGTNNLAVFRTL